METSDASERLLDFIIEKLEKLCLRSYRINHAILNKVEAGKIITSSERREIEREGDDQEKARLLYNAMAKDPRNLSKFVAILRSREVNFIGAAEIFDQFRLNPVADPTQFQPTLVDSIRFDIDLYRHIPSINQYESALVPLPCSASEDIRIQDLETFFIPRDHGIAREKPNFPSELITPHDKLFIEGDGPVAPGKRFALIINNNFDGWNCERKGSDMDLHHLSNVLIDRCGFEVYAVRNCTSKNLEILLKKFKGMMEVSANNGVSIEACVVCVMSHGKSGDRVLMTDQPKETYISAWNDIIKPFNNKNCKQLIGKPKMFFFQFCRGGNKDKGIATDADDDEEDKFSFDNIPTWTDILVAYSTLDDFVSYRNKLYGSWFIQTLCRVIKENGTDDICLVLKRVAKIIKTQKSSYKQVCPFYNVGFTEEFKMIQP